MHVPLDLTKSICHRDKDQQKAKNEVLHIWHMIEQGMLLPIAAPSIRCLVLHALPPVHLRDLLRAKH